MKEVYYNGHNVPPTWRNRGVEMKVDGKYIPLPGETHVMVSEEDEKFCIKVAHEYKLNLNEFCALVDYAKNSKRDIERRKSYHPLSEMLINGGEIKEISVTTTKGTAKLNDPYFFFLITRAYKVHQQFEITFRGLLANLLSYLENQKDPKLGRSQCHTIIGMICSYLEIYPINYPLPKEHQCASRGKWKAIVKGRVKELVKQFDI